MKVAHMKEEWKSDREPKSQQCHFIVYFLLSQETYKEKNVPQNQYDKINKSEFTGS